MNDLIPFEKTLLSAPLKIQAGFLQRSPFEVHLDFRLQGTLDHWLCPSPEEPLRQDELWKSTCFEAFLGQKGGAYIEINCSPSGHWNAYEFDSYRKNMRPAEHITVRLTRMEKELHDARFFIQVLSEKELEISRIGLTMVFESTSHEKSYWALRHPTAQPDFHHAEGWVLPATR